MSVEPKRFVVRDRSSGKFAKLGGYWTDDLQEAQVIGWQRGTKHKWRWPESSYDLVAVRIVEVAS